MIPKIINYCWFGGKKKPKSVQKCIDSWKKYCPDYQIIEWNEKNFDIRQNNYAFQAYKSKKWAFVSDFARLSIIYNNGGIYLDTDVELIKSLDDLLEFDAYFGREKTNNLYFNTGLGFGAKKGNRVVELLLMQYESINFICENGNFDLTPCTDRNSEIFNSLVLNNLDEKYVINNIAFLSTDYLCPIEFGTNTKNITTNTISIHHFDGTWQNKTTKIKSKLYNIFYKKGENNEENSNYN